MKPTGLHGLTSLRLEGATLAHENTLRQTRMKFRDATGIHTKNFEDYGFHITLAYSLGYVAESLAKEMSAYSDDIYGIFAKEVHEIDLGPAEFCNFENMHHFEPVYILDGK